MPRPPLTAYRDAPIKILLIRLGGIGDVVMGLPLIRNLKAYFREAEIHYLTDPASKAYLEAHPDIDRVILVDRKRPLRQLLALRRTGYTAVLDSWKNPRTALQTWFSGAPYRVSFAHGSRQWAYNLRTPHPEGQSLYEKTLRMLEAVGVPVAYPKAEFPLTAAGLAHTRALLEELLGPPEQVLAVLPTGGWPSKRADTDTMARFAHRLATEFGLAVALLGSDPEKPALEALCARLTDLGTRAAIVPPVTTLELGCLLAQCGLVLGNDSGPTHIAATSGAATLALFGPTLPQMRSYGVGTLAVIQLDDLFCIRCELADCPRGHECFRTIPEALLVAEAHRVRAVYRPPVPLAPLG